MNKRATQKEMYAILKDSTDFSSTDNKFVSCGINNNNDSFTKLTSF